MSNDKKVNSIGRGGSLGQNHAPKSRKTIKSISLPDYSKWSSYKRKMLIPFTLNPADWSNRSSPWKNLTINGKRRRIINFFVGYKDIFIDYFIAFEFGDKNGRFHAHGMLYLNGDNKVDYWHFLENIKNTFGDKKNKNACFKGSFMNSEKDIAFDKCYNYTTKDIIVMFKSRFKIKWTSMSDIKIIKKKKIKIKFFTDKISKNV